MVMPRLVLIDDEEAIRRTIAKYFRERGWEVMATDDPDEAETVLEDEPHGVVVLDLGLSRFERNGLEVLRSLRHAHRGLPVAILSAFVSSEVEAEARRLGAHAVLKKPMGLPDLADVVSGLAGARA